jgi:hypothetical protein
MRLGRQRRTGGLKARASVGSIIGGLLRVVATEVATIWRVGVSVNRWRGRVNHKRLG